jgi:hypothetical protein
MINLLKNKLMIWWQVCDVLFVIYSSNLLLAMKLLYKMQGGLF